MKETINFYSCGNKISGDLYLPKDHDTKLCKAVIVVTPWGGVKEQTSGVYAKKLSEKGFIALAFDHSSYGASEGVPRCNENPFTKVEDIKNAISFIETVKNVDLKAISALGICSGAAYVAYAAATQQKKLKSIATISGYFHDLFKRKYFLDAIGKNGLIDLLEQANLASKNYLTTGVVEYVPHIPDIDNNSLEIVKDFYSYYRSERGSVPNYVCKTLLSSLEHLASFSALPALAAYTPKPCLMIVGSRAESAYESEDAIKVLEKNGELFVINGANHTDLYDKDQYVDQAVNKIVSFL